MRVAGSQSPPTPRMLLNRKRAVAFAARCPLSCATLLNSVGISEVGEEVAHTGAHRLRRDIAIASHHRQHHPLIEPVVEVVDAPVDRFERVVDIQRLKGGALELTLVQPWIELGLRNGWVKPSSSTAGVSAKARPLSSSSGNSIPLATEELQHVLGVDAVGEVAAVAAARIERQAIAEGAA